MSWIRLGRKHLEFSMTVWRLHLRWPSISLITWKGRLELNREIKR